ncbi:hypothetical protein LIER_13364 [Lithospermum erythrorhizon]|uniref:Uncharacterized protein n=1 Tax=Lithospermum erythrorhizon TaxID=34254 RepID=A0AAV3PYE5_LITER
MTSCMDARKIVSLDIPFLASIYRGVHLITTVRYPSNSGCYLLGWIGTYLWTYTSVKTPPPGPYMLFTDDQLDSVEDMTFFLSLRTNMVGYREDAYFLLEAYNPHLFSKQLGLSLAIPGCKSRSRDTVLSFEGLRSAPLGPGKGKSSPRLPSPLVPLSSKPLKKRSVPEGDAVDKDPKHAKWGNTRRPDPIVVLLPDAPVLAIEDIVPSSEDEAHAEVVDIEEPSDCMITEVASVESSFAGVQCIESIFRDSLKVSWEELCSLVEDRSYEILLSDEEGTMASFQTLKRFSRQDVSSQDEQLAVVFSKAHYIRDAQCSLYETEDIGSVRTTLQQSEERASRLRQELTELDIHLEDLRCQVIVRESVITGLEAEQVEFALKTASLDESIKTGRES